MCVTAIDNPSGGSVTSEIREKGQLAPGVGRPGEGWGRPGSSVVWLAIGCLASMNSCYLGPRSKHEFLVGVGVPGQAPAPVGRLSQQHPGPAWQSRITSRIGGDLRQPLDNPELLAAIPRPGVGEHLNPHVAAVTVDVGP